MIIMINSRSTGALTVLCLLVATVAFAGDDKKPIRQPKSVKAVEAIQKRDRAVRSADEARAKQVEAANKAMQSELKIALQIATKSGDLAEANAIDAAMKSTEAVAGTPGEKGPAISLTTTKSVLGTWLLGPSGGALRPVFVRSDHIAVYEDDTSLLGLWLIKGDSFSISWTSGITDSVKVDENSPSEWKGSNSRGTPCVLKRKG